MLLSFEKDVPPLEAVDVPALQAVDVPFRLSSKGLTILSSRLCHGHGFLGPGCPWPWFSSKGKPKTINPINSYTTPLNYSTRSYSGLQSTELYSFF